MIQAFYDKWQDKDVAILTINQDGDSESVVRFMDAEGLTFPVLLDENRETARLYQVRRYPTTFFIDSDGFIRDIVTSSFQNLENIENSLGKALP